MRDSAVRLRGVLTLLVPLHFQEALASRAEEDCPLVLLTAVRRTGEVEGSTGVGVFALNGSLDPEDEIWEPRDFWMNGRGWS
jgi:hypothetical protein